MLKYSPILTAALCFSCKYFRVFSCLCHWQRGMIVLSPKQSIGIIQATFLRPFKYILDLLPILYSNLGKTKWDFGSIFCCAKADNYLFFGKVFPINEYSKDLVMCNGPVLKLSQFFFSVFDKRVRLRAFCKSKSFAQRIDNLDIIAYVKAQQHAFELLICGFRELFHLFVPFKWNILLIQIVK